MSSEAKERQEGVLLLYSNFENLPDKKQAWEDLIRRTQDENWKVRMIASQSLGFAFSYAPDKEHAWQDLHHLTDDGDFVVRWGVSVALVSAFQYIPDKEPAWQDLIRLTADKYSDVRWKAADALGSAFQHVPDKEPAWQDLIRLTADKDRDVQWQADALGSAFQHVPDKEPAWQDLIRLTADKDSSVRRYATQVLCSTYQHVPDKDAAWRDLIRLTVDKDSSVRRCARGALGPAFQYVPDKDAAWRDLIRLTEAEDIYVRLYAADVLGSAYQHVPDEEHAWQDLHRLTADKDSEVRWRAAYAIRSAFQYIPDKEHAWQDLHRLTADKDSEVRLHATYALGHAYQHVPYKERAWRDLIRLTEAEDIYVRSTVTHVLGFAYQHVPDKEEAWQDLHRLTEAEDMYVRLGVAEVLGSAYQHIPDKKQAWQDLHRLTADKDSEVRVSANHSLGRASIFKATEAESEDDFESELNNAIKFFERSSDEAHSSNNPSSFCLPFYRSFCKITFGKARAEGEVKIYLAEAKSASEGSKSKETLLEAVENLANALSEAQKVTDFDATKSDLNAYMQYCDRAADLIGDAEEGAPGAAQVLRRGLPIIDERIKEIIAKIQEKTEALCRQTRDTPFEDLGKEINRIGQSLLQIRNPIELEKRFNNLQFALSDICVKMPEEERGEACDLLKMANEETYIEDRIVWISMFLSKIPPYIDKGIEMTKIEIKNSNVGQIGDGHVNMKLFVNQKEKSDQNSEKRTETKTAPHSSDLEEPTPEEPRIDHRKKTAIEIIAAFAISVLVAILSPRYMEDLTQTASTVIAFIAFIILFMIILTQNQDKL